MDIVLNGRQFNTENLFDFKLQQVDDIDDIGEGYTDTGRADIVTAVLETPFMYEDKQIIGFCLIDKYKFAMENQHKVKRHDITLYHL